VTVYHVRFTCARDYMARRLPFRPAHLKQLAGLRDEARVVAGGPEPDGSAANIFYRVAGDTELARLLEDNEFYRAALFVGHEARPFAEFLEPLDRPPVDAGLAATIVEGVVTDRGRARAGLGALQREQRVAFGGIFTDGALLAVVRSPTAAEAVEWLRGAGALGSGGLSARPWSQTL
jgi:uncharacterized protein YciI